MRWSALALGLVIGAATAAAQPAPDAQAQAEQLFAQGKRAYDVGDFAAATAAFKQAYQLSGEPLLLFNIAQAERKQNHCEGALNAYRAYLRNLPDAPNRAKVEAFIVEAEACTRAQGAGQGGSGDGAPGGTGDGTGTHGDSGGDTGAHGDGTHGDSGGDTGTHGDGTGTHGDDTGAHGDTDTHGDTHGIDTAAPSAAGHPGRTLRWAGLGAGGVGLVALGFGAYYAREARAAEDYLAACQAPCAQADWQAIDRAGQSANRRALGGFVVGGVGVLAGATLYVLGWRAARGAEAPVVVAPTRGGATVHATLRF